jgi:hypothetical protein
VWRSFNEGEFIEKGWKSITGRSWEDEIDAMANENKNGQRMATLEAVLVCVG